MDINKEDFLGTRKMWKLVLSIAIPSMLAQFVNVLYSIVDRIYISHMDGIGNLALASIGVCAPIVMLISSFAFLIGLGGAPIFSISLGEKDTQKAEKILANCFLMLSVVAIVITIIAFACENPMLKFFGASETLYPLAKEYFNWAVGGSFFAIMSSGLNCFIIAQGFAKTGMFTVILGAVANIILDPLFIFTFDLGVAGAAIATMLSQVLSTVFAFVFLISKKSIIKIKFRNYSSSIILRVLSLGFSPFIIIATDSLMLLAVNYTLQRYGGDNGDMLISSATILFSFMQIITLPLGGITGGTQPILSYNYGARNTSRVKKGQITILALCLIFTTIMFIFAQFFSKYFVMIFTSDPALIDMTVGFIKVFTIGVIPLSFQYAFVDGLTALGIAPIAISLSMFRKIVVMLTLILVLPNFFGATSVFYSEPIADIASAIASSTVYLLLIKKILRKREQLY